ncbi:MAG: methyltransferase [Acidimicrobiales bacterium]
MSPAEAHQPFDVTDQYFNATPTSRSRPTQIQLVLPDLHLGLTTDRGVFSADRVDAGTKALLLDGPPLPSGPCNILDLGAGYGPIAITLAKRAPHAIVWAIEVNERARALCLANAAAAGVADRVHAVAPDGVPSGLAFAQVWTNPPIRIGKPALHDLLDTWLGRLAPDGSAALVVQRHLGADSLARWLTDRGWVVRRRASNGGYRLLDVVRTGDGGASPSSPPRAATAKEASR